MATRHRKEIWDRSPPKKARHTKLSSADKSSAKAAARRAGRPYPNLVDNMRAAKKKASRKKTARKKSVKKAPAKKKSAHKKSARKS